MKKGGTIHLFSILVFMLLFCPLYANTQKGIGMVTKNQKWIPGPKSFKTRTGKNLGKATKRYERVWRSTARLQDKLLVTRHVGRYKKVGRPELKKPTLPPVTKVKRGLPETYRFDSSTGQNKESGIKHTNDVEVKDNKSWIYYIKMFIPGLSIKQEIDKMENQLFKDGIRFNFEVEEDEVGYIYINTYEYKLDAA